MKLLSKVVPILSASLLLSPILCQPAVAISQQTTPDDWEYITDAKDGTLYFAGKRVTVGKTTVMEIKAVNDPDEPAGSEYTVRYAFNCKTQQVKLEEGWEPVKETSVGNAWLMYACGVGGK